MTPTKKIKSCGLQGLTQVCTLTGQSPQTISNWHYNKPDLFELVLLGCKAMVEIKVLADMVYDEKEHSRTLAISNRLKELVGFDAHCANKAGVNICENIEDHIAKHCECGSVNFALLKSGKIECNKCGEIHKLNWIEG